MTQRESIAWAAGLFEGEGYVISRPEQRRLGINMTDLDALERFQAIMGGRINGPELVYSKGRPRRKPVWKWTVSRWADTERVARAMLPLLCARRKAQVEVLLANPAKQQHCHREGRCNRGHVFAETGVIHWRGTTKCAECHRINARKRAAERGRWPKR